MTYNGKTYDELNGIMHNFLRETSFTNVADYPMTRDRWLEPYETTPDGKPCFIKHPKPETGALPPIKNGYVWGPGPNTFGYYHLLTRNAHIVLYARVRNNAPAGNGCCCFGKKGEGDGIISYDDWDDLKRIYYARSVAGTPNDAKAAGDAIAEATSVAQGHHQFNQNIQAGAHFATAIGSL